MKTEKSLVYRVASGKALGLIIGLIGFFLLPVFVHEPSVLLRAGVLFWYPTIGALVGIFGVFAYHPVFDFPMPWWLRGALLGAWMNFVLVLLAFEQLSSISNQAFVGGSVLVSPFWLVLEGAIIGMCIDYLLTRWFGEGWVDKSGR